MSAQGRAASHACATFPSVRLQLAPGTQPVEIHLIAQMPVGSGDSMITQAAQRQRQHPHFLDALDEPSVRLAGMHPSFGDPSSLYSFVVGEHGHPFHRHAGTRMFTAVAGSSGALLRFSFGDPAQISAHPEQFMARLQQVQIPPDCLFSVRFGAGTWHQFLPQAAGAGHAALFALSCHADELGGALAPELRQRVQNNEADLACLTELLPDVVQALLDRGAQPARVHALSLYSAPDSGQQRLCAATRRSLGRLRSGLQRFQGALGFVSSAHRAPRVRHERELPRLSLLSSILAGQGHDDCVAVTLSATAMHTRSAADALQLLLAGFLQNPPQGVGLLMRLRNLLVRPLRLRTARLGCPVSSLRSTHAAQYFAGRFPVLAQQASAEGDWAEVILGADDRHLRFRTSVSAQTGGDGTLTLRLATRVHIRNLFGRFYMACIRYAHEQYVAPALLEHAVAHALACRHPDASMAAGHA